MRTTTNIYKHREKVFGDLVLPHSIPVFRRVGDSDAEFEGSGFLLAVGERLFLVTAAHVLRNCRKHVMRLLGSGTGIVPDREPWFGDEFLPSEHSDRDIAAVQLTQEDIRLLDSKTFIWSSQIPRRELHAGKTRYYSVGYRADKQIQDLVRRAYGLARTTYSSTEVEDAVYARASMRQTDVLLLRFSKRSFGGPKGAGGIPSFRGMSGAPVWRLNLDETYSAENPPYLAGLIAGKPKQYGTALLCIRSQTILSLLLAADGSLGAILPQPA